MKKIYLVLFVILSIFVFSCKDNLISDDLSSSQNSGVGQVKVFVKQSRLIGPDVSDVDWTVELRKDNENDTISGKNENGYYLFSGLSDGTYIITVFGKIDDVEKFTGSAKVTITNGNSVSVNVPIIATKNPNAEIPSTGYATITMEMSEELLCLLNFMGEEACLEAKLSMSRDGRDANITAYLVKQNLDDLYNIDSIEFLDNQKVEFVDNSFSSPAITENPISTGYYYLTFSGLERLNYTIKLKDNLVEIGDGLTTNIVLTQNDYELVEVLSESEIFYVDNSDNEIDAYAGTSLSKPLGFRNINDNSIPSGIIYLISDVNTYKINQNNISSISDKTIASFGSKIFSIINNKYDSFVSLNFTTLKNIKLTNTPGNGFYLENCVIDGSVILDTPIAKNLDSNTDSTVIMNKSSNLVIGQNFSGELGICLFPENWQLGDTVVTFENGKPDNSNFYISENDDIPTGFASMFYIDDNGKLAQYDATSQWVNFAWNEVEPCLVTQTQAKNKTYTSIYDSTNGYLYGFNGISTYDEENQTWYFIANGTDGRGYIVPSLYKVSAPTEYTDIVSPEKIEVDGNLFNDIQAMSYDNGKLYFGSKETDFNLHFMEDEQLKSCSIQITSQDYYIGDLTSLLVKGNDFYIATTLTDTIQQNVSTTHSAIWKYELKMEGTANGTFYNLIPVQTYKGYDGAYYPVPYYLTHSDIELTVNGSGSFPEGSTFRITDLYSDGTSVYGLLANYIEIDARTQNDKVYMRGSVFKLKENTTTVNANHFGLRNSLSISDIQTAKQSFILPRKIVGIVNKKLIIADDGMIPDKTDCNLDRFILFDLDGTLSEIIDVNVPFTTSGTSSAFATGSLF